jgi:hypothetical protein
MLRRMASERGQSAAELVAIVPILVLLALALGMATSAGWAAWSAANAARAGARAAEVGGDAENAALRSLPDLLRKTASVDQTDGVQVKVEAPTLLPGLPSMPLTAGAALDPAADDGQ